jgi:hypothetical protein
MTRPLAPGDLVRVVQATDRDVYDVSSFLFETGTVLKSAHDSTWLFEVRFDGGREESFWLDELEPLADVHTPGVSEGE